MNFDEWLYLDVCTICRIIDSNQFYCFLMNFYSFDQWLYLNVDRIDGIVNVRHFARFSLVTMIFMYFDECLYLDVYTICRIIDPSQPSQPSQPARSESLLVVKCSIYLIPKSNESQISMILIDSVDSKII